MKSPVVENNQSFFVRTKWKTMLEGPAIFYHHRVIVVALFEGIG